MFDPSKLNLEIDENTKKTNKDIMQKEEKKVDTNNVLTDLSAEKKEKEIKEEKIEPITVIEEENNEIKKEETNAKEEKVEKEKIIYDINIRSIKDIFLLLVDKEYDFVTFEPNEENIKINFRKNKIIVETKYIKHPVYSNILIKAKVLTKLKVDENEKNQEWFWDLTLRNKWFKIISKVVPWDIWEKLFLKLNNQTKKTEKKVTKKMTTSQILTFLGSIAFIWLIVWWWFVWFIALNAKTVEDVKFFAWLWINLNDINNFISQIITIIFSILLLFETVLLIIFLFKFSLTKKEFKKTKIKYWILSALLLIITFSTASGWMIMDKKINSLPNWQEMAFWEVQIFDNSKLISDQFDKEWALITDTSDLIWPIDIKFDLSFLAKNQESKWIQIKKFTWDFGDDDIVETPKPTIIKKFSKKGTTEIKLTITEVDIQWNIIEKIIEDIKPINLSYIVNINEKKLNSWWKLVSFDASSLNELGKIEWFFIKNLNTPEWTWSKYILPKPIFEETIIWMYIRRNDKTSEQLDKIFIIKSEEKANIEANIDYHRWVINDLEFTFKISNIKNDVWSWYIEKYLWNIWEKEYSKVWDIIDAEKSSEIKHTFKTYWDKIITVELTDSSWEKKTITKKINIPKVLKLNKSLDIYSDEILLEDIKYDKGLNEYFIDNLWIPNKMKFDARFLKADSTMYSLKNVEWDYNSDWDIDGTWNIGYYDLNTEWNHIVSVLYTFVNKKISTDEIKINEKIYIETIRKEAIIDFKINKESSYVPVIIWFDASRSQVKDSNIAKFIWDYWDWITEERDAIIPWHKYSEAWEYEIKLTVVTEKWKRYSTSKNLILKPKAQTAEIKVSMKNAPIYQWIDFTSDWSQWQITSYFWDFWDWETSTKANPTHSYSKKWEYKIKLRIDFINKNIQEDTIEINIYE